MKTIKIAHLYYDIMNLYGENGNIRYLVKKLEEQDLKPVVYFLSLEDDIDFNEYDFYFIGSGSDSNKRLVLKHLLEKRENIKKAYEANKFFLITGNALDLFGKSIKLPDEVEGTNALNFFDYIVTEEEFRTVGEQYMKCPLIEEKVVGFQNRCSVMTKNKNYLFEVIKGSGSNPSCQTEGIHAKNFYGTYTFGPLLVRNPYFTDYLIKEICNANDVEYKKPSMTDASYKAYHELLKNFYSEKSSE